MASASSSRTKSHIGTPPALVTANPSFGSDVSLPVLANRQPPLSGVPTQSSARKAVSGPANARQTAAAAARHKRTRSQRVKPRLIDITSALAIAYAPLIAVGLSGPASSQGLLERVSDI